MNRNAEFLEDLQHADVRETARASARKRDTDSWRSARTLLRLGIGRGRCEGK
jgi:hypothetical protein